ncbi:MAG: aminoglycoside phosphotransferase family protein [Nanoarchaeota archaeon]|nr:aminoglycoside phosphotransferase family protein [Nanoarchaeota archaeon]MBU1135225.1 aminoglycoside phosphotransferase family protein [Nanoarchaeota archaeon]MBU2519858.1 aminoglycoside phosphotransferase family protein [Nanoarchaeota archaeon]
METERIKNIIREKIGDDVLEITVNSRGSDQTVYIVTAKNSNYVIKFPKNDTLLFRQGFAYDNLHNIIPMPKILATGEDYLVESFIEGDDLDSIQSTPSESENIYFELGSILKKIHSKKMEGFGIVLPEGRGKYKNMREFVNSWFTKKINDLENTGLLLNNQIGEVRRLLNSNYLDSDTSVLLHNDFNDPNIRVKNGKVTGIIDFGDLYAGPPSYDLVGLLLSHYSDGKFEHFLDGYGRDIDSDEIDFFSKLNLTWIIPYHHNLDNNEKTNKYLEAMKYFFEF